MNKALNNGSFIDSESPNFFAFELRDICKIGRQGWFVLNDDGSISKIFRLTGIDSSTFVNEDYAHIFEKICKSFSKVDESITFQFSFFKKKAKELPELPAVATIEAHASREFYDNLRNAGECFDVEIFLSVNCYPKVVDTSIKEKFMHNYNELKQFITRETDTEHLNKKFRGIGERAKIISDVMTELVESMRSINIGLKEVSGRRNIAGIYLEYFRPNESKNRPFNIKEDGINEGMSLREQIMSGYDVEEKPYSFYADDNFHRMYQIDTVDGNRDIFGGEIKKILRSPFEQDYHVVFRRMGDEESFKSMKSAKKWAMLTLGDEKDLREDPRKAAELERLNENFMETALMENAMVQMTAFMGVRLSKEAIIQRAKSKEETLDEYLEKLDSFLISNYFSGFASSTWRALRYGQYSLFCHLAPGQFSIYARMYDYFIQKIEAAVTMFPIWEQKSEDEHFHVNHYYTDDGNIYAYDLLSQSLASWSSYTFGPMGSGKSVILNKLIACLEATVLRTGRKDSIMIRGIDYAGPAGSFFSRVAMMDGLILKFNGVQKPKFNPLELDDISKRPKIGKRRKIRKMLMDAYTDRFGYIYGIYERYELCHSEFTKVKEEINQIKKDLSDNKYTKDIREIQEAKLQDLETNLIESEGVLLKAEQELEASERDIDLFIDAYYNGFSTLDSKLDDKAKIKIFNEVLGVKDGGERIQEMELAPGECLPNINGENFIMTLFEIFLSADAGKILDGFATFSRDEISDFIRQTYERIDGRFPIISDVIDTIEEISNRQGQTNTAATLIRRLSRYSIKRNGTYDSFDVQTGDIDTSNPVILFDLYGLGDDPSLEKLYTIIVMQIINRDIYYNMDKQRLVFADEIHKTLSGGLMDFLVEFVRVSRKYKCCLALASQNLFDFHKVSQTHGGVILKLLTRFMVAGVSDVNDLREIASYFELPASAVNALKEVGLKKDPFSTHKKVYNKFLLLNKLKSGQMSYTLLQNAMSPTEIAVSSSDKSDNFIKDYLEKERGLSKQDAIILFAKGWLFKDDYDLMAEMLSDNKATKTIKGFNRIGADVCKYLRDVKGEKYLKSYELFYNRMVRSDDRELFDYLIKQRDSKLKDLEKSRQLSKEIKSLNDKLIESEGDLERVEKDIFMKKDMDTSILQSAKEGKLNEIDTLKREIQEIEGNKLELDQRLPFKSLEEIKEHYQKVEDLVKSFEYYGD